ncbi:hypothetical protein PR048_011885 [Dryococelus australis]|uniref:Uncharacterized protein n=1 Tax=Dryococelus australis TaxID=614101 RepID=A0ABQ9HMY1_9NEOP|nr:hypothetical protein PR048_011885 [Dryococelus australis]
MRAECDRMPNHRVSQSANNVNAELAEPRYDRNTARLARRSDEALGVHASVAHIAPWLLDLGRGVPTGAHLTLNVDTKKLNTISTYTRQNAKSKYRNSLWLKSASQKQCSDTHKTPYDRVKRCCERKINIKAPEHVNVDVFTQNKRPRKKIRVWLPGGAHGQSAMGAGNGSSSGGRQPTAYRIPRATRSLTFSSCDDAAVASRRHLAGTTCFHRKEDLGHWVRQHRSGLLGDDGGERSGVSVSGRAAHTRMPRDGTSPLLVGSSEARIQGWGKREIPEKTRRTPASYGTIPTCENPGVTRPEIKPGCPWWEPSSLIAHLPWTPEPRAAVVYSPPTQANRASTPGEANRGPSHVGNVVDDAACRQVFSGFSHFPHPYISALFHTHFASPTSALKTSMLRSAQISPPPLNQLSRNTEIVHDWKEHFKKQSSDTHKTPYNRVKRCQERKINIKASECGKVDVFTQYKRPAKTSQNCDFDICHVAKTTPSEIVLSQESVLPSNVYRLNDVSYKYKLINFSLTNTYNEVLRAVEGEARGKWSSSGTQGRGKQEIIEKTRQPAALSGTIPTCENPGSTPPRIVPVRLGERASAKPVGKICAS